MTADPSGRRILIVEEEYFIAADPKRALLEAQAILIGPVGDAAALRPEDVDAAMLDVNLAGTSSFPAADALTAMPVPRLFVTGHDGWSIPERDRQTPFMVTPFVAAAVVPTIGRLARTGGRS